MDTTADVAEEVFGEVLAGVLGVERVAPDGHFFQDLGADSMSMAQFCARVRKRPGLPSVSMKDIYQHPTIARLAAALAPAAAPSQVGAGVAGELAEVLAGVLGVERVAPDGHFFQDLGADSMSMAQFCARVRKRPGLPSVSMKDIYRHPTISSLTSALAEVAPAQDAKAVPAPTPGEQQDAPSAPAAVAGTAEPQDRASAQEPGAFGTAWYLLCGTLQLLIFLAYCYAAALLAGGYEWISAAPSLVDQYGRAVAVGSIGFLGVGLLPVLAKWLLIGRWKATRIRIWSLGYVRFWTVKTLVRWNPMALLLVGTPLYSLYLRALGAKIGRGVVIFSKNVPICADLLTIGAGSLVRKDAFLPCYRAQAGWIEIGPVTLGEQVFVGEKSVLDIGTSMGNGAQLGHASVLHSGQRVPDGERWHGCPGRPTDVDYLRVAPARCGTFRRAVFGVTTLLQMLLVIVPLVEGGLYALVVAAVPSVSALTDPNTAAVASSQLYLDAFQLSLALFVGAVVIGLLVMGTLPRVMNRFLTPGKVYPLYGFHYGLHRAIARLTNVKFFMYLFGDSSYVVHYLRGLGYDLSSRIVQTGSNFGMELAHDNPYLSSVGSGSMVADGLALMNADYSSTSFRLSPVAIGRNNFVGNNIAYPAGGRTGDNVLLATKVMIPLDGAVREGVGLLGSPCFEIPRAVDRDLHVNDGWTPEELRRRLAAKNRYDLRTMAVYLFARWLHVFVIVVLGLAALDFYVAVDHLVVTAFLAFDVIVTGLYFVVVERCFTAWRPLSSRYCSISERYFWWHERLWKTPSDSYLHAFDGTPFKNVLWRLLGVRLGRRVFDDGCYLTERTLVTIGDDCTLNQGTKVQCHSQEDGAFKSGPTIIGAGCTLGVAAMIHYGVTLGDGAVIGADSFVMKGEEVPSGAHWAGNPAQEMRLDEGFTVAEAPLTTPDVARSQEARSQEAQAGDLVPEHLQVALGAVQIVVGALPPASPWWPYSLPFLAAPLDAVEAPTPVLPQGPLQVDAPSAVPPWWSTGVHVPFAVVDAPPAVAEAVQRVDGGSDRGVHAPARVGSVDAHHRFSTRRGSDRRIRRATKRGTTDAAR